MFKRIATFTITAVTSLSFILGGGQVKAQEVQSTPEVIETYNIDANGNQIQIDKIDMGGVEIYGVKTELENEKEYDAAVEVVDDYINELEETTPSIETFTAFTECKTPSVGVGTDGNAKSFNNATSCHERIPGIIQAKYRTSVKKGGWIEGRWYGTKIPSSIKIGVTYQFTGIDVAPSLSYPLGIGFQKVNNKTVTWYSEPVTGYWYLRTAHQEISATSSALGLITGINITTEAEIYSGGRIYRPKSTVKH